LFFETTLPDTRVEATIYSLKQEDHLVNNKLYLSFHRLYLELEDITEYEFAKKYLHSYEHWEMLCKCNWFKPHLALMRRELDLKLRAKALRKIQSLAKSNDKDSFAANKYLLEKNWEPKAEKGRPSKEAIREAAKAQADEETRMNTDFERIAASEAPSPVKTNIN
jgi:hypothetical protein